MKYISLTQNYSSIIDSEDYDRVSKHSWCLHNLPNWKGAQATIHQKRILLHRFIMGAKKGQIVDHINGDSLDNRKENLRFVNKSENSHNWHISRNPISGTRGVHRSGAGWEGTLIKDRIRHRKHFLTLQEAVDYRKELEARYL